MIPAILIAATAAALTLNVILLVRFARLSRRHREAKIALNRVAGQRDELRWERMLAGQRTRFLQSYPAQSASDRGGCNGRINGPGRPVSSEEADQ